MSKSDSDIPEIEITPEMIEAGLWHALRFDPESSTERDYERIVIDLFRAMLAVRKSAAEGLSPH